jgi:hypothetical protein
MGAFVAPLVHRRRPASSIVLVNAMIPVPGETPGAWWENTGQPQAKRDNDLREGRDPDQQRIARDRLGIEPDLVPGGHLVALSHRAELVDQFESCR